MYPLHIFRVAADIDVYLRCVFRPDCETGQNELTRRFVGAAFLAAHSDYKYHPWCFNVLLAGSEAYTN